MQMLESLFLWILIGAIDSIFVALVGAAIVWCTLRVASGLSGRRFGNVSSSEHVSTSG